MSNEEGDFGERTETHVEDAVSSSENLIETNPERGGDLITENELHNGDPSSSGSYDQLVQMVVELGFQNEFLKTQYQDFKNVHANFHLSFQESEGIKSNEGPSGDVKNLHLKIESLSGELAEEKQTRGAAEEALKHLRAVYSEADAKAQELSAKLAEAEQNMEQQLKERDEKYTELDSKFNRLHKRAKQRIQEVQKEKEDLEAQFHDVNEKAERALLQVSTLQQDLERTRQQANEVLKAIDVERQQLRNANNKLRENIEELQRSFEPKENAIEALQQSLLEKDQMLEDMKRLLQAADEKRQASIAEITLKNQKTIENLEVQLADSLSDRAKATETISSLQRLVAEKESKIAEMDAALTGEAARLRAAMETLKGELTHSKQGHENEKESWEVASQAFNRKLEIAESNCLHAEFEAAKMRSQLELELSVQTQLVNTKGAELVTVKEEIKRLESEFAAYKVRAHALLQKKDAELAAAVDSEQLKSLEEALKETENEILSVSAERDKTFQEFEASLRNHNKELSSRDASLRTAEEQITNMESKLASVISSHQLEKDAWEKNLRNMEETWQLRYEVLKAEHTKVSSSETLQKELAELRLRYKKMKEENDSFHDLADRMIEEKDKEITRLLDHNKNLHQSLAWRPPVDHGNRDNAVFQNQKQDALNSSSTSAAEQQILILARQQAQREEELAQSQRHILALQEEIEELERENRLHSQQETMLKEELRTMERKQKREGVDMTYLKNVIVKLLETGEVGALLPVVAMLLQFSPEELQKCQQAYRSSTDVQTSMASDASGSGLSLFSRFPFS